MIKVENITKRFDRKIVLENVSLVVARELIAVLGPTGTGKSVLLKIIIGLMKPDFGQVLIDKDETIGFVFQHSALFDSLSVKENISLPLEECSNLTRKEIDQRVVEVANMLKVEEQFLKRNCTELSGGERKIVAIARAIISDPTYIFYDEPTTGFDPITHDYICEIIKSLSKPGIVVTHNVDTIKKIGTQSIFLLKSGKLNKLESLDVNDMRNAT